jgi:membrane protease YdiL (CAAX protease family)
VLSRLSSLKQFALAALAPFAYLLLCASLAALLAYPLYRLAEGAIGLRPLVSRGGLALLVLGLFPVAKHFGLNLAGIGLEKRGRRLGRQILYGFGGGVLMLTLHTLALIALDVRTVDWPALHDSKRLLTGLIAALATGTIVAAIEETMFRGVLLSVLRKVAGIPAAVVISAFYYSALHFLRSDFKPAPSDIGWDSGFRVMESALEHALALPPDSFLALFLAGVFLACVRELFPGGLGYCVGLHAGWVFVIKYSKTLTNGRPPGHWTFLVGSYDGFTGYLAAAWTGVLILLLLIRIGTPSLPAQPLNFRLRRRL